MEQAWLWLVPILDALEAQLIRTAKSPHASKALCVPAPSETTTDTVMQGTCLPRHAAWTTAWCLQRAQRCTGGHPSESSPLSVPRARRRHVPRQAACVPSAPAVVAGLSNSSHRSSRSQSRAAPLLSALGIHLCGRQISGHHVSRAVGRGDAACATARHTHHIKAPRRAIWYVHSVLHLRACVICGRRRRAGEPAAAIRASHSQSYGIDNMWRV